jgi:DNA polymerase elongation subunit (family B)
MQSFLIVDVSYDESDRLLTHLRLKALDGSTKKVTVEGCIPRFWSEKNPSEIPNLPSFVTSTKLSDKTTITGVPLYEIRVEMPSDIKEIRDYFYPHYSADVSWSSLVRWIYGWTAVVDIDTKQLSTGRNLRPIHIKSSKTDPTQFRLDVVWFDIETADSLDTENAPERVVSIAFVDSVTGIHEIGTTAPTSQHQVRRFLGSQEALESIVEHTSPIPPIEPDKVRVESFSHLDPDTNEAALLWWFKQRIEELDRDLLGGQHIIGYDIPYLKNRSRVMRNEMNRRYGGSVPVHHRYPNLYSLLKIPLFDSKIAYAEQVQGAAATTGSGSLAWMAGSVLGYGKVPRTRITDLMVKDPMMLAVYNAWDNVCVERCMNELNLVPFYLTKTAFHNSVMKRANSNMMLVEDMMGHLLFEKNIIMPSVQVVKERRTGGIEQGGFVMENPIGVYQNAFELDNSMEYPSVIITTNGSPDTLVNPIDYPDGFPFPITTTPAGRIYRRDREGIMPSVLRHLATLRKETQSLMREAYESGDDELGDTLNRKQRVQKESMNSWYGVLGSGETEKTKNRPFRLALPELGSDITEIARIHNQWNKDLVEASSLWFSDLGIEPFSEEITGDGIELRFHVIGQDTDSCKVAITNHDEAQNQVREFEKDDVVSIANILCIMLNKSYDRFVQETMGVEKNEFFFVKPDAHYERFFSWGVKKRYAYRDFSGKHGFRGVEIRRSSAPKIVKDAQHRVFNSILTGCNHTELNVLLREIHSDLMDVEKTTSIDFGQPMGMKKKGTMAHTAAMWSNSNLKTEFDIGDKPVLFLASSSETGSLPSKRVVAIEWGETPESFGVEVDRQSSFDKHFTKSKSWAGILGAFNTSWTSALAGMSQTKLDEWFR